MAGEKPRLSALAARKQLLIAESELNRNLLAKDCENLLAGVRWYVQHARNFGSLFSLVKLFSAGFLAFRAVKPAQPSTKWSWLSAIATGAARVTSLWSSLRSRNGKAHD